jgi:nucleoside-diphosphate-sugar epimerase
MAVSLKVLITGSDGLIGSRLAALAEKSGVEVGRFDIRRSRRETILDPDMLSRAIEGVDGVVHLAAVSRVVWGERDPALCKATNVDALANLLRLCGRRGSPPWVLFGSSREVYGEAAELPVGEDSDLAPLNVYARSKCEGERLMRQAAAAGMCANICRFSSVYGSPNDHADRVAMAFAGSAARGGTMQVEGGDNVFDFTSVDDVVTGLLRLVELTAHEGQLPPVHFVSGKGTTLRELARLAAAHARAPVSIKEAPPRAFDVKRFIGDPGRAASLLGWRAVTDIAAGMSRLIEDLCADGGPAPARPRDMSLI